MVTHYQTKKNNSLIPFVSDKELKKRAGDFLLTYNKEKKIPVPIEEIAEYDLDISIMPTPGLEAYWGIDGFITSPLDIIVIDKKIYYDQVNRARFTIAHEVSHKILHKKFYEKLEINSAKSYLDFQENENISLKPRMEYQAYFLAGYILLPETSFNARFKNLYGNLKQVDVDELSQIMNILSSEYKVSGQCLQKQIEKEFPKIYKSIVQIA